MHSNIFKLFTIKAIAILQIKDRVLIARNKEVLLKEVLKKLKSKKELVQQELEILRIQYLGVEEEFLDHYLGIISKK